MRRRSPMKDAHVLRLIFFGGVGQEREQHRGDESEELFG